MRIFAFYLPQFHETPENNEWWGDGFTEWTNVRGASKLFASHDQPKVPLNNNYYNLLNKEVVEWQTSLMNEYGVNGLIYYHYYFKGKLLLEKPAENLLKWKEINQSFFFCWANHSWMRSWEGSRQVLVDMDYGCQDDWEKHFQYLIPFFKDSRYEKKNNCPIFMIFKSDFEQRKGIFDYFDKRCKDYGFDGICLIESYHGPGWPEDYSVMQVDKCRQTQYIFIREPAFSTFLYKYSIRYSPERVLRKLCKVLRARNIYHKPEIFDGRKLFLLKKEYEPQDKNIIHGVCFEWDNTPRHKSRGYIITPIKEEDFLDYANAIGEDEYLFINAWNEWAEGMFLEPTQKDKYKYLEWIKNLVKNKRG